MSGPINIESTMRDLLSAMLRGDLVGWPFSGADDAERFLTAASAHGVRPLLERRLREAGALEDWPEPVRVALGRAAMQAAIVEELLQHEIVRVLAALARSGVRPFLMKGAALAYTHYGDPALRPRCDTDLLMRRDEVAKARDVMSELGYAPSPLAGERVTTSQRLFTRRDVHGLQHAYDLHWAIANPRLFADVLTVAEIETDAIPVPALGAAARALGPVHALLLACVHRVAHHNDTDMLIWVYDIHVLLRQLDRGAMERFGRLAADKRMRAVCASSLRLAEQCFDAALPDDLVATLEQGVGEPSAGALGGRTRNVDVLLTDLKTLPDWRRRIELLREHVFPPAAYMRQKYGLTRRRLAPIAMLALPVLYIDRFVRGMPRWFRPVEGPVQ